MTWFGRIFLPLVFSWGMVVSMSASPLGVVPPYRSDLLERMAAAIGSDQIDSLPDGEHYAALNYGGYPVTIIRKRGTIEHIGYSFFPPEVRTALGVTPACFIERYALEADLPLPREMSVLMQMLVDDVSFARGGSLTALKHLCEDPSLPVRMDFLGEKKYIFTWDGEKIMAFPAKPELLTGRGMDENDRRLPEELSNALPLDALPLPDSLLLLIREDGIGVWEGSYYLFPQLNTNRYYWLRNGEYTPVNSLSQPFETIANILTGVLSSSGMDVQIKMAIYGLQYAYFSVGLDQLIGYGRDIGCTSFWGRIAEGMDYMEGLWILRNTPTGYNHVFRIKIPYDVLEGRPGTILAHLLPFVPTYNLKYLFEELKI